MAKRNKRMLVATGKEGNNKNIKGGVWKGETEHGVEYGSLEYVLAEVCKSGLCYHFCQAGERDHEHTFAGVLRGLVAAPEVFSVEGFEDEYSEQELNFLKRVKEELTFGGKTVTYVRGV